MLVEDACLFSKSNFSANKLETSISQTRQNYKLKHIGLPEDMLFIGSLVTIFYRFTHQWFVFPFICSNQVPYKHECEFGWTDVCKPLLKIVQSLAHQIRPGNFYQLLSFLRVTHVRQSWTLPVYLFISASLFMSLSCIISEGLHGSAYPWEPSVRPLRCARVPFCQTVMFF